jgi:hypothetical protein
MKTNNVIKAFAAGLVLTTLNITAQNNSYPATGNVGLGISPAESRLHVLGEIRITDYGYPILKFKSSNPSCIYNAGIYLDANGSTPSQEVRFGRYLKSATPGDGWQCNPFRFSIEAPEGSFVMTKLGKVVIGLTNGATDKLNESGCKLFVGGGIMTEKVKVMTYVNWADYVFSKEYKLTPLVEVENFIKQNNHLSEIPSATEIEKNGLDLAEISKLQMQKIEELTLYLIEQNKHIVELNKRIEQLENR